MLLAVDGVLAGQFAVADPIKPTTADAIRRLHGEGLRVIMLTGDNRRTGEAVAARLGIDEVIVDVLPQDKDVTISRLKQGGRKVDLDRERGVSGKGVSRGVTLGGRRSLKKKKQ